MFVKKRTLLFWRLECFELEIEMDVGSGLHRFSWIGEGAGCLKEAGERVVAAIRNTGLKPPYCFGKMTAALNVLGGVPGIFPGTKEGGIDFAIAVAFLEATGQIVTEPKKVLYLGGLSLDGRLRPVKGIFSLVKKAEELGYERLFLPFENWESLELKTKLEVIPLRFLKDYYWHSKGKLKLAKVRGEQKGLDSREVEDGESKLGEKLWENFRGGDSFKKALIIAAAGGHNFCLAGFQALDRTLACKLFVELWPELSLGERKEVEDIYQTVGLIFKARIPIREVTGGVSEMEFLGGGSPPRLGECSLAHKGILIWDDFLGSGTKELKRLVLVLKEKRIELVKRRERISWPADFVLGAAVNLCGCGLWGDKKRECLCTSGAIMNYRQRFSWGLLDSFDIFLPWGIRSERKSGTIKIRGKDLSFNRARQLIAKVQLKQKKRQGGILNGKLKFGLDDDLDWGLNCQAKDYLGMEGKTWDMGNQGSLLRLARTIADLEGALKIEPGHLTLAQEYQNKDFWFDF